MARNSKQRQEKAVLADRPLADWDDNESIHPNLVWWNRLDDRFQVEVHRTDDPYRGVFKIFDHHDSNRLLKANGVGLSFGARFGPDVADVQEWQDAATAFIDERKNT